MSRNDKRPLLKGKDPHALLAELARARNPIYAEAHFHIRSEPAPHERAVDAIVRTLAERRPDPDAEGSRTP